ncbi:FmdB family zinc ribbon protein [Spongiactinospora sp. TRM90649]|uniref:FmdB family zinc ribbon protein n=1 Tax=Spongiactinospora sp. TRM90649 TaxID=3031114 RepID=UPI0023FA3F0D|nr:FmdB family zinc ribbon protein [Spongiactinospora sp. TRM90649]MDF5757618.1 zinc ribbon domain-containing protein [Spongiactinospora sp. TRM90649]
MPTYQYACTACGEQLEVVQKFTDAALTECPSCEGALRKVFSAVGIVFKGSGFYRTDSRSSSTSSTAPASSSNGDSKSKSSESKSDTPAKSSDKGGSDGGSGGGTDKAKPTAPVTASSSS